MLISANKKVFSKKRNFPFLLSIKNKDIITPKISSLLQSIF